MLSIQTIYCLFLVFFFNDTATTEIYTLSLHDALPICSTWAYNMTMILDGHTGIEHAVPVAPLYKDALTLFAKSRTQYTPTLIVGYGGVWGENYWYQQSNVYENRKLLRFTPRANVEPRARRRMHVSGDDFYHFELAKTVRDLVRAGGKAQLGAHGQLQGLGVHWELWMLQQGGLTPLEALRAATLHGAQYLGLDGDRSEERRVGKEC